MVFFKLSARSLSAEVDHRGTLSRPADMSHALLRDSDSRGWSDDHHAMFRRRPVGHSTGDPLARAAERPL